MTNLTDEFFETALAGIQERLDDLITQPKSDSDPPEKFAKSISALMKAKADVLAQQEQEQAKELAKHHTRYEDMPPPTPEDEERFYARFRKLVGLVNDPDADARAMVLAQELEQKLGAGGLGELEDR
jgi:polyphosphate kinase